MVELVVACCESIKICVGLVLRAGVRSRPDGRQPSVGLFYYVIETHLAEVTARSSPYDS